MTKLDTLLMARAALKGMVAMVEEAFGNPEALAITIPLLRAIDECDRKSLELRKRPGSEGPADRRKASGE